MTDSPTFISPSGARIGFAAVPIPGDVTGEEYLRVAGRAFMLAFHGTMRNLRLYPFENATVQASLRELAHITSELFEREGKCEFRVGGEFLFVNGARLRLLLENYASFSALLRQLRQSGVGSMRAVRAPSVRDWAVLLGYLMSPTGADAARCFAGLLARLEETDVTAFALTPLVESDSDHGDRKLEAKDRAKRTYARSVAATKEVINSVRMGQSANLRQIKRVVQGIVDHILSDEQSLMGLTTIRDYDDYTFTHSVNVCIFSIALGRRLALSRMQLYDLGMAALFHDIGKARLPAGILNKSELLSDDEWRAVSAHPWLGVLALFAIKDQQELPYRAMLVSYQHHMKRDLTGYPRSLRTREMTFFSKIVACADGFDAATTRRAYQTIPMAPSEVLRELRDNPRRGHDPTVVKAFINLMGIYPVGTLVVLDTFELAIVHSANPDPELLSRPLVCIVSDAQGNVLYPGTVVNLAERVENGDYRRTIIKTADPDGYGIRVDDYFL